MMNYYYLLSSLLVAFFGPLRRPQP